MRNFATLPTYKKQALSFVPDPFQRSLAESLVSRMHPLIYIVTIWIWLVVVIHNALSWCVHIISENEHGGG